VPKKKHRGPQNPQAATRRNPMAISPDADSAAASVRDAVRDSLNKAAIETLEAGSICRVDWVVDNVLVLRQSER